jgi:magnesium-transporting ATPase (P-type)
VATVTGTDAPAEAVVDAEEPVSRLLRDLRTSREGLSSREAARRLVVYGRNELERRGGRHVWRELGRQFTHPLALLLWVAAGLAWLGRIPQVAIAIVVVIALNAAFAFFQELQAEHAVEALRAYLPQRATALRDGAAATVTAAELVPGDVVVIEEGERISADARLLSGSVEVDASALTGESVPVTRSADLTDTGVPFLQARDLVFSGTTCTGGEATAVVVSTGMHTELGRIAALSQRVKTEESPLDHQVRRVAWLIAVIAAAMAVAFMPVATLGGGLAFTAALVLAVGLIAGNVPEGLLPVITLSLAMGVRDLAGRGAVVKRLSAVETLGSTDVICTDKTGTLTENHMRVTSLWTLDGDHATAETAGPAAREMLIVMVRCSNAPAGEDGETGDPTEIALLEAAAARGVRLDSDERASHRLRHFHFDPRPQADVHGRPARRRAVGGGQGCAGGGAGALYEGHRACGARK